MSVDQFLEARGADSDGIVRKAFRAPGSWDRASRSARFVMTTEEEDRYGDIVRIAGVDLDAFLANPVVLPFHSSRSMPVGTWEDVEKVDRGRPKRIEGRAVFPPEGEMAMADEIAKGVQLGLLRGASIGFMPKNLEIRMEDETKRFLGYDILESELFECSIVAVPANPRTLVRDLGGDEAVAKRILEETLDTWLRHYDAIAGREAYEEALARLGPARTISAPTSERKDAEAAWKDFSAAAERAIADQIGIEDAPGIVDEVALAAVEKALSEQGIPEERPARDGWFREVLAKIFASDVKGSARKTRFEPTVDAKGEPAIVPGSRQRALAALVRLKAEVDD